MVYDEPQLVLRDARPLDSETIRGWRSDSRNYEYSRVRAPVEPEVHGLWFAAILTDPTRKLLVGSIDGVDVGTIRLDQDPTNPRIAEGSISLNPDLRGRGLGELLLNRALAHWYRTGGMAVTATVHRENTRSLRLFTKVGFTMTGCYDTEWLELKLESCTWFAR